VARANGFVEETAPWNLAKHDQADALGSTLGALARALARISLLASPYMPGKTQLVWAALGLPGGVQDAAWRLLEAPPVGGRTVQKLALLFPKVTGDTVSA
jgi:methionyl-tRNA synthetase